MSVACPTCGQIALPPARYCRACYTVFPTPRFAAARQQPRSESRVWQLAFLLALAVGGWWAYNSDAGGADAESDWTSSAPDSPDRREGFASTARAEDNGGHGGAAGARRPRADGAAAPSAASADWLLHLAPARICGGAGACEVTIHFASGERARFAVRRQSDSTSALVPLAGDGGALLDRYGRARVIPQDGEDHAISIVSPGGRRWLALGGG